MQSMVHGTPSEDLIRELKMHSPTLERLNDGFRRVYEGVNILTIYEMEPTASLRRNELNTWERTGPPVMMVEKHSAILYWPMETRIGLNQDHSRIAKVDRGQNGCYDDICYFLQQSLISTRKAEGMTIVNAPVSHSPPLPSSSTRDLIPTPELIEAIKSGDSNTARDLIQLVEKGSLTQLRGNPLSVAIEPCPETMSALLEAGADISAKDDEDGDQAIHIAGGFAKSPDTVQLVLNAGADVHARGHYGWRPLDFAARYNSNPMIIQVLINAGAVVNAALNLGCTPLHLAASYNNNPMIAQYLIDGGLLAGANVDHRDDRGCTAWHRATISGNKEVARLLLEYGADKELLF